MISNKPTPSSILLGFLCLLQQPLPANAAQSISFLPHKAQLAPLFTTQAPSFDAIRPLLTGTKDERFEAFLARTKKAVLLLNEYLRWGNKLPDDFKIHIVMGNQSADMDSSVSSVFQAYILSRIKPAQGTFYFPLMNSFERDFELRKDVAYWFNHYNEDEGGIKKDDLVFLDHFPISKLAREVFSRKKNKSKLAITLIDHNELPPHQKVLTPYVVTIFDHHKNSGIWPGKKKGKVEITINDTATNTITMVINDFATKYNGVFKEILTGQPQLVRFLYGGILMDASNKKGAIKDSLDKVATKYLEDRGLTSQEAVKADVKLLKALREDTEGFSPLQLLLKDAKDFEVKKNTLNIVSFKGLSLEEFKVRANLTSNEDLIGLARELERELLERDQLLPEIIIIRFKRSFENRDSEYSLLVFSENTAKLSLFAPFIQNQLKPRKTESKGKSKVKIVKDESFWIFENIARINRNALRDKVDNFQMKANLAAKVAKRIRTGEVPDEIRAQIDISFYQAA